MSETVPKSPRASGQAQAETADNHSQQPLTADQRAALDKAQKRADIVRVAAFPAAMSLAIPIGKETGAAGFKLYLDGLLRDTGNPADPIERMIVEQLALAHHRIGQLHVQTERAKTADEAKVYAAAAVRLTGEFRRLALALRQYHQPMPKRSVAFIRQQNLSAGNQQVAYLGQAPAQEQQIPLIDGGNEQTSKRLAYAQDSSFLAQPEACCSRPEEPALARPADARGPRTASAGGAAE